MKFKVIYADPPYKFNNKNTGGSMKSGSAKQYPVMKIRELLKLPVLDIVAKNAWLFLWSPASMFRDTLDLFPAWGFKFKTIGFVWYKKCRVSIDKPFFGMGFSTRQNAEFCLVGTRGYPTRASARVRQVVEAPVREHSRKPDEMYPLIEQLCGRRGKRLELFARYKKKGWYCHGNQIRGADVKFIPTYYRDAPKEVCYFDLELKNA